MILEYIKLQQDANNSLEETKKTCENILELMNKSSLKENEVESSIKSHAKSENVEKCKQLSKLEYEMGNYENALKALRLEHLLRHQMDAKAAPCASNLWGQLACSILLKHRNDAMNLVNQLKEVIDKTEYPSAFEQLEQKKWLLHWSIFVLFSAEAVLSDQTVELFSQSEYVNAVQNSSFYLMRYFAVAVILNRRRKSLMKELVRHINVDFVAGVKDPILDLIHSLFVDYDLTEINSKLNACIEAVKEDPFLLTHCNDIYENLRIVIFEIICKIYSSISVKDLMNLLAFENREAGEKWVLETLKAFKIEGKFEGDEMILFVNPTNISSQLLERSKQLASKATYLLSRIEKGN